MPVTGLSSFRKLKASFEALALPGGPEQAKILAGAAMGAREAVRESIARTMAPNGSLWPKTKRGGPALQGNKIPSSFGVQIVPGGIAGKSEIEWLETHQVGHRFPQRTQGERSVFYGGMLNKRGDEVRSLKRLRADRKNFTGLNKRLLRLTYVEKRKIAVHAVGARELPARPLVPEAGKPLGEIWTRNLNRGVERGLRNWAESAT